MSKRLLDLLVSFSGLVLASPVLLPVMFLVWWQDRHSPFYVASRMGLNQRPFKMVKLRSMRIGADRADHARNGAFRLRHRCATAAFGDSGAVA